MNRIPQNDPGFLNFQRSLRARNRKKRWKRTAIVFATVLLLLSLAAGGVFLIWKQGEPQKTPSALPNDTENTTVEQNPPENPGDPDEPTPDNPSENPTNPDEPTPDNPDDPDDPPEKQNKVVYVDAGHGFSNSYGVADKGAGDGTPYHTLTGKLESDLNLEIAMKVKEVLISMGYDVRMSRESESTEHVTINERVKAANDSDADIFVSIHANSSTSASAKGARVYYSTLNLGAAKCERYANCVAAALNSTEGASLKTVTVNTDRPDVGVIKGVRVPTVLVETCFLTNEEDAALAASEAWIALMAEGICRGIDNYFVQSEQGA